MKRLLKETSSKAIGLQDVPKTLAFFREDWEISQSGGLSMSTIG